MAFKMRILLLAVMAVAAIASAKENEPERCTDVGIYGLLDFWLGKWDVYSGSELVGTNRIEKVLGGCAVLEHWTGGSGGQGKSLFYVAGDGVWKQVWVTEWATRPGGVKEKSRQPTASINDVRFQSVIALPDGRRYLDRTTLTQLETGDVRQLIEISQDGGDTWETRFDAIYRRSD